VLKTLVKHTDNLIKAVDKLEKKKDRRRKKVKAKKVTKPRLKKEAPTKTLFMRSEPHNATDQVLRIFRRSKGGVNAATLIKKTGLDVRTVRNILYRAVRERRIKGVGRGIYVEGA
jgi:hypothetical protein